jgi:hypothetical protein
MIVKSSLCEKGLEFFCRKPESSGKPLKLVFRPENVIEDKDSLEQVLREENKVNPFPVVPQLNLPV